MTRGWDGRWPRLRNPLMPLLREVGWGGVGREDEKGEAGGPSSLTHAHTSTAPGHLCLCHCVVVLLLKKEKFEGAFWDGFGRFVVGDVISNEIWASGIG